MEKHERAYLASWPMVSFCVLTQLCIHCRKWLVNCPMNKSNGSSSVVVGLLLSCLHLSQSDPWAENDALYATDACQNLCCKLKNPG